MKLVTVLTAFNPADAHVANSRLEASGFHSVVTGELAALSLEGYAQTAGGIRVQVPEAEAEDARTLLNMPADDAPPG